MLRISEVVKRYGVSRGTIHGWVAKGLLTAIDVAPAGAKNRRYRFPEEALAQFEAARASGQQPRPALPPSGKVGKFV